MNSRMDKYGDNEDYSVSRTKRNQDLYHDINKTELTNFKSYNNVKVIEEGAKEIDLEKIKNYIEKINDDGKFKRKSLLDSKGLYEQRPLPTQEEKDYDLISVLEKAREKREVDYQKERYKKLRDTQYDILSELKIYDQNQVEEEKEEFNTQEKTLIDLINTVAMNKNKNDLLSELQSDDEDETIVKPIEEETNNEELKDLIAKEVEKEKTKEIEKTTTKEIKNLDESFYTSSIDFSKEDFEDFDDIENDKGSIAAKIGVVVLILCILGVLFVIANFVFELNIF